MVEWEQLNPIDGLANSQWNGVALPPRWLDDDGRGRAHDSFSLGIT
jgi:hypothetical protein